MEWGVFLCAAQPPGTVAKDVLSNSTAYAVAAEKMGFSHAWVLEHHFTRYGLVGSALTQAAFILGKTKNLKVGTAIQVVPLAHPVRLAEDVALIDQMSGGRLMFGIGRGAFVKDFTVFDVDMTKSRELTGEWYDIMRAAWTEGRCSASTDNIRFPEVEIFPEPLTRPHPPVYSVAQSPESIEFAAKRGMPMILDFALSDEEIVDRLEHYAIAAESAGLDPSAASHVATFIAGVDRDGERVRKASLDHLVWWCDEFFRASEMFKPGVKISGYEWHQRQYEQRVLNGERDMRDALPKVMKKSPIGTPQECIDKLARTKELTGITKIALGFEALINRTAVLDSMQLFAEEVMPHLA